MLGKEKLEMNKCKTCYYWSGLPYNECFPREQIVPYQIKQCSCSNNINNFSCRSSNEVLLLAPRDARPVGMFTGEDYGCVNHMQVYKDEK